MKTIAPLTPQPRRGGSRRDLSPAGERGQVSLPWVVKIGGRLCEDPLVRARLAAACAELGQPLVIVHGGGCAVTELQAAGQPAVGLSGCDGGMVQCELVSGLGAVGIPVHVAPALLTSLLASGYVPVISPVSLGPDGQAVNVNADELACALAAALGAERLLLLSDVPGVRVGG